jgi:hypothetical protein
VVPSCWRATHFERAVRLEHQLLAAKNTMTACQPCFDEDADMMAVINEQQIFEVRQPLSEAPARCLQSKDFRP